MKSATVCSPTPGPRLLLRRSSASCMMAAIDATAYRDVIGRFASGVAIVTCQGTGGPAGLTTNAVTSLSLDPLLLLVCFDNGSRTLPVVREARRFAVNVLRAGQEDLAAGFASQRPPPQKFAPGAHTQDPGGPGPGGAPAGVRGGGAQRLGGGGPTKRG